MHKICTTLSFIFLILESLHAATKDYDTSVIKEVNFNFDTNVTRTEEGDMRKSHPEFRANARIHNAIKELDAIIEKERPDIIHIQECRYLTTKFGDRVDSFTPFYEFFGIKKLQYSIRTLQPKWREIV